MEIQVRGSLNKESEVFGGLSFELYERYAYRTDKAAVFLSKQFLSRILDAYYYKSHDILAEYDHVIYSDSDGKKVIMLRYDTDTYKVTVRKRDIPDIINYLRDNYNFFYDPNRKELEEVKREAEIEQYCGKNREDFWRKRALKAEDDVKGLSLKVERLEEACGWKDRLLGKQTDRLLALKKEIDHLRFKLEGDEYPEFIRNQILQVYREIFDCSNGDPEGTDAENLTDILTEYKRVLKLKDDAETDNDKWRRCIAEILGMNEGSSWGNICIRIRIIKHDKENISSVLKLLRNGIREAYTEVFPADANDKHWFAYDRQAITDIVEALKRERALKETAEEKAIGYKEELRSVNESFEYQTLELCKILGLDAGSPPEDILEAVIRTIQCRDLLSRAHGDGQEERSKFLVNLAEVLGVKFSHFGCYPIMEREIQEALYLALGDNKEEAL